MIELLLNLLFGTPFLGTLIVLVLSIFALRRRARWTMATGASLFTLSAFLFFAGVSYDWSLAKAAGLSVTPLMNQLPGLLFVSGIPFAFGLFLVLTWKDIR